MMRALNGEVAEWSKAHAWKVCIRKRIEGSNPSLIVMVTLFVAFLDRLNLTCALPLMANEYGCTQAELQEYGPQLMGLFYVAYGFACIFITPLAARWGTRRSLMVIIRLWALSAASLVWVIVLSSRGVFFLSSYQASEFAILQQLLPRDKFASLAGLYNGASISVGGGLGPLLMAPIIGDVEGTWMITVAAVVCGLMLLPMHRSLRC